MYIVRDNKTGKILGKYRTLEEAEKIHGKTYPVDKDKDYMMWFGKQTTDPIVIINTGESYIDRNNQQQTSTEGTEVEANPTYNLSLDFNPDGTLRSPLAKALGGYDMYTGNPNYYHGNFTNDFLKSLGYAGVAGGTVALPFLSPTIAGALTLYGGYDGAKNWVQDWHPIETFNKVQNGDYWGAAKDIGKVGWDVLEAAPFVGRVMQGAKQLANKGVGIGMNYMINRYSPNYTSSYNWRTGKFNLSPRATEGANSISQNNFTDALASEFRPKYILDNSGKTAIITPYNPSHHVQGKEAVQMFKDYGGDYPVRLYRIQPKNLSNNPEVPEPGREKYIGMWFTDDPEKPAWYAHIARQGKGKAASDPLELQYIDVPSSKVEQYRASNIVKEPIEYEPEDFLIPLDYPRQNIEVPPGKLLEISKWLRQELPLNINMEQLMKYVPEARERYGLVGNTDITDEEIAQALYKHSLELGGNTGAVNSQGEPQLLFRSDTRPYTKLRSKTPNHTLEELDGSTMDNILGINFLDEIVKSGELADEGTLKYLHTINESIDPNFGTHIDISASETVPRRIRAALNKSIEQIPNNATYIGSRDMTYKGKHMNSTNYYKVPSDMLPKEYSANDINAFIVRTPQVRDMTKEMQTLNEAGSIESGIINWLTSEKPFMTYDKDGYPIINYKGTSYPASLGSQESARELWWDQYNQIMKNAQKNNQGLLMSKPNSNRREHKVYTYFTLPDFNLRGAKHLLPYDFRVPRDWSNPNIYKFTDNFGNEITPTPYTGDISDFWDATRQAQTESLKHYFSREKIKQIKETMGWGDTEMNEFQDELLRLLSTLAKTEVKNSNTMKDIASHNGAMIGSGNTAIGKHTITYNKDRISSYNDILESAIHELGGHGATAGLAPEKYGINANIDKIKLSFPRTSQLMEKNKEIADETLKLNDRGIKASAITDFNSPEKKRFNYINTIQEQRARGFTQQLMDKLVPGYKTLNIKQLEDFYTPESVETFKNKLLQFTLPLAISAGTYLNSKK